MIHLGFMYANGQGVPQDYAEAVKWYRLAAEQGDEKAQFNLGFQYANGQGVPQNHAEAYVWFNLAAASGDNNSSENRDILAETLSLDTLAAARQRAAKLFEAIFGVSVKTNILPPNIARLVICRGS